jgi:YegS/Rv2252/BmrU family lipid kinase
MLLVNPFSGKGVTKTKLGEIVKLFCENGCAVTVYFTQARNTTELAREHCARFDLLVCVGGDGTLSDVVAGLATMENPPPIGYIPAGTANDVASTLSLSRDVAVAVKTVLEGELVSLDVGTFENTYFTYIAAFGAFTGVSYGTPQSTKKALGHLAYVLGGLADMTAIRPRRVRIEYDGGVIEDDFIFGGVTNSTSVAGLVRLDPRDVNLGDGMFEVILVKNPVNLIELRDIIMSIATRDWTSENVRILHTARVCFTFAEPVMWTRDGEDGGAHSALEIVNRRRAVRVIIPKQEAQPLQQESQPPQTPQEAQ